MKSTLRHLLLAVAAAGILFCSIRIYFNAPLTQDHALTRLENFGANVELVDPRWVIVDLRNVDFESVGASKVATAVRFVSDVELVVYDDQLVAEHLSQHPSLTQLQLDGTKVSDKSLEVLLSPSSLRTLSLKRTSVTAAAVEQFHREREQSGLDIVTVAMD